MLQNEIAPPPVLSRLSGGGLRLMPGCQAPPGRRAHAVALQLVVF